MHYRCKLCARVCVWESRKSRLQHLIMRHSEEVHIDEVEDVSAFFEEWPDVGRRKKKKIKIKKANQQKPRKKIKKKKTLELCINNPPKKKKRRYDLEPSHSIPWRLVRLTDFESNRSRH